MTHANSPVELLATSLRDAERVIARATPDQAGLPTPCASWDVRALISHAVYDTEQFTRMARGAKWESGDLVVEPDQWRDRFTSGADKLLATWRDQDTLDAGSTNRISQQIAEFAVHGWDIARATGQPDDLDPEVAAFGLAWARQNLKPEYRGDEASGMTFGVEVPIAADAPAPDRLAAFFGRHP